MSFPRSWVGTEISENIGDRKEHRTCTVNVIWFCHSPGDLAQPVPPRCHRCLSLTLPHGQYRGHGHSCSHQAGQRQDRQWNLGRHLPSFQMARCEACSDVGASKHGFRDLLLPSKSVVWGVLCELRALPRSSLAPALTSYVFMKLWPGIKK